MPVCNVTRAFGFMWPDDNWPHLRRTTDILLLNHRKHSGRLEWTKIFRSQRNTTVCTFTLTCFRGLALVWLVAVLIYLHETHTHKQVFFWPLLTLDPNHTSAWRQVFNTCKYRRSNFKYSLYWLCRYQHIYVVQVFWQCWLS